MTPWMTLHLWLSRRANRDSFTITLLSLDSTRKCDRNGQEGRCPRVLSGFSGGSQKVNIFQKVDTIISKNVKKSKRNRNKNRNRNKKQTLNHMLNHMSILAVGCLEFTRVLYLRKCFILEVLRGARIIPAFLTNPVHRELVFFFN